MLLEDVNKVVEKLKEKISDQLNETKIIETRNIFINKYLNPIYEQLRLATVEQKKELGLISKKLKDQIFLIVDERLKNIERDNENKIHLPKYNINIETANFTKGSITPISMMMNEIVEYFESLNFKSYYGSEVVPTSYNFDRLNIGPFHPARDPKDCFFINDTLMLRAHCTAVTAQILENNKADDIRIVTFGNVYRNDDDDNTHSHQFTQVDIVWVRDDLSLCNLKWLINGLVKHIFGNDISTRYRLSHFPFTEPSFEVDITCPYCKGKGCPICKHAGWIEVLGAGMLHKNVLETANLKIKTGMAAGIGVERFAMIKYGFNDIRDLYSNDFRILKQFKGGF